MTAPRNDFPSEEPLDPPPGPGGVSPPPEVVPVTDGPILKAVQSDLQALSDTDSGADATLRAMAVWLATVADTLGVKGGPAVTARLAQELRATMLALVRGGEGDTDAYAAIAKFLSTPVLDPTPTGTPDAGAPSGRGRRTARKAAPAVAKGRGGRRVRNTAGDDRAG